MTVLVTGARGIAAALAWPDQLFRAQGWEHEIWSGADPVLLANLRFLAGYRRPGLLPEGLLDEVLAAVRPGDTIGGVDPAGYPVRTGQARLRRPC